jgi:enterochelin esterase-like enzyme
MRKRVLLVVLAAAVLLAVAALGSAVFGHSAPSAGAAPTGTLAFNISFSSGVSATPITGRVFVIVSTSNADEPRLLADDGGVTDTVPFWGKDVTGMQPGSPVTLDGSADAYGYPLVSVDDLPAGDYYVQALLNVYTTFHRSDGSIVSLHMPGGDGNDLFVSPGNLVSTPVLLHLDPVTGGTFDLQLDQVLPPLDPVPAGGTTQQGNPVDSAHVKHIKIQSKLLSEFWGQPMYLGANILLPEGYDSKHARHTEYPVIWRQTHFPFGNPFGFSEGLSNAFSQFWVSKDAPRLIVVDIRHETPFFDDSYAVNSANMGPYGDAITKELMPAVNRAFRTIDARWARTTTGGSTGGWEAIAQQVFYPKLYSGAWIFYPDPLDFHFHQLVDIYDDANAYLHPHDWLDVPRPSAREVSGDTEWTMEQENHWEAALGTHGRSGLGQWDVWQAVYGPQGADGYPAPIWDKLSGAIDPSVAQQWLPKDMDDYVTTHWDTLAPLLKGRLSFFVGTADTFFLNNAVRLFQKNVEQLSPAPDWSFDYGVDQPHGYTPYTTQQLVTIMAQYMADQAPKGHPNGAWLPAGARHHLSKHATHAHVAARGHRS